ncbi:tRNA (guanosine(46)-N7)-methyltransferase TrmB [Candidatus Neptunochlamydia vexilliferae]|uniref:tRNA (guanine-N(7)-)-methyltransferase n=1 Tax=Candidatus Neptunichlamydia vexilliferae TaxID=1651774 RepID=A0ABS0AZQ6_9BACT|nr:tRNA (guanosine(46)-N7)-methyltransferase TrmB [Candidatus Neptunochlamydia vexilliferae]MBF5059092.1 tRNA (guanine-N(7)-)-methyltransferase [Candidatus Neptunochlamydia vexilliferae]
MKPKDLKRPYSWEERHPLLKDQVFYVPEYYDEHKKALFPPFQEFFGNENPVHLEYCSGNGEWIINRAQENPEVNWIAVEIWFERVRKIYSKTVNYGIDNLMIISGEGLTFAREYLPESCLDAVYVNFPDPWPKDRHAKHRIIQRPFVDELKRTVKTGGTVTLVTDDPTYKGQMEYEMQEWPKIAPLNENYGSSFFERLWLSKGRDIYHMSYANH